MIGLFVITLIGLSIFSFGFVDANFPVRLFPWVFDFVHANRPVAAVVYISLLLLLFWFYLWAVRQRVSAWKLIFIASTTLFFSFPGFSYDIFNYIATAKVTYFYRENPYIVMPIELPGEPMLGYMHAANKTALYGPAWILMTWIPVSLGAGNIIATVYMFKALILGFYLLLSYTIWILTNRDDEALRFFALNPLVMIESLISAHNDVVMMAFALLSFFFIGKKKLWLAFGTFVLSVLIKFSTLALLPVFAYACYRVVGKSKKVVQWDSIWLWSAYLMLVVFALSPLREELYSWYMIWPITFIAIVSTPGMLKPISIGLSFGMLLRFAPFIWVGEWGKWVPFAKKIVTIIPPSIGALIYHVKKIR